MNCNKVLKWDDYQRLVIHSQVEVRFLLLFLFSMLSGDRYIPRGSKENVLSITTTCNIFAARCITLLVTISFWIMS